MKKIKLKKIVYPVISAVFLAGTVVVFVYAAKFLSTAVNKAFIVDEQKAESLLVKLNIEGFLPVAEKMGIQISQEPETNQEMEIKEWQAAATAGETTSTVGEFNQINKDEKPDRSTVEIAVYNSTKTSGLAAELKSVLETDGFTVEKTGNVSPALTTTVVKIKESKKDYGPLIKNAISGKYPRFAEEKLEENEVYDVIIVIGGE